MNNHPQGIQRNSNVLIKNADNTVVAGICASADNIGITLIPTTYWEDYTKLVDGYEGSKERNANDTLFFPWSSVDFVRIWGGNK